MPIANCFFRDDINIRKSKEVPGDLSQRLNINISDITINFIQINDQIGKKYELMVFLYLPSLWSQNEIERIGLTFIEVLSEKLNISAKSIFLITNIIQSGHVINNKMIEKW